MIELIIGEKYALIEDEQVFVQGILTSIYEGREDEKPCVGVVFDNKGGFLIDKFREIKKI